ncbi:MAG: hypothetical protein IJU21_03770 [Bacteroidales bacterium]|nr:hypothetical protein [Bacteroidales bacterium]
MKTRNYLLPHSYKKVGMWMFLPFAAICLCLLFDVKLPSIQIPWIAIGDDVFYKGTADLLTEVGMLGMLASLCFIALSREKDEDEMTAHIRMQSFVWSLWFTSAVLAFGILFIMGLDFLSFALVALYLYYLVYILKFNFTMKAIRRDGK